MKKLFNCAPRVSRIFCLLAVIAAFGNTGYGATYTVTKIANTSDDVCDADCSFREAIIKASGSSADDVINFAPNVFNTPQTILIPGGLYVQSGGGLTINGPGANLLTISANNLGRVLFFDQITVTINNIKITGGNLLNAGLVGGGIALNGRTGVLNLNNSIVTGNSADIGGGGIASGGGATLNINNSTVSNNVARGFGGGIRSTGPVTIRNSTISGNSGSVGGGIYLTSDSDSVNPASTITNSTINNNSASWGGGVAIEQGATLNLLNATVAKNSASKGGGAHGGGFSARNSIFADNTSNEAPDFFGFLQSQGNNLIENTSGTNIQGDTSGNILGQDPLLGSSADNGGLTLTLALQVGSPAIDAANPTVFPPTDQRGLARPADGNGDGSSLPDIGAFERNALPVYRAHFDFDGDGVSNISVFRPSTGIWYTSTNPAINYGAIQFGAAGDVLVPADYDGDGKTDLAVFRPSNGTWYVQRSQQGFLVFKFGVNGDVPFPADYNGDGTAEFTVFRPSSNTWFTSTDPAINYGAIQFGAAGDVPVPADYDGDGRTDIAVWRPSNGIWYRLNSSNNQLAATQFGANGDLTVPADYDGDRVTDIAVFRPSNGVWYLQKSLAGFSSIAFGLGTDSPVPADYDGDGKTDVAVFRPSNSTWYLNRSTAGFTGVTFGDSADAPIPSAYVR